MADNLAGLWSRIFRMNFVPRFLSPVSAFLAALFLTGLSRGAESAPAFSAAQLASKLSELRQDGSSYVRLRMEVKGGKSEVLQLQIKQRLTKGSSDVVYQVLFPKERKGEAVLLKKTGGHSAIGSVFVPPNPPRALDDLKSGILGSDLSYEDVIDNFYAWDQQALVGLETVDNVSCQVLESKPGKGDRSSYGSVRSWVDVKRLTPLRVEKYSASGQVVRRIDTTRVVEDGGHHLPANLVIHGTRADSSTELDGSRIKHDVSYSESEFSVDGLKEITAPHGSPP